MLIFQGDSIGGLASGGIADRFFDQTGNWFQTSYKFHRQNNTQQKQTPEEKINTLHPTHFSPLYEIPSTPSDFCTKDQEYQLHPATETKIIIHHP